MTPKLSIVVPAFNESKRLGASLRAIGSYFDQRREDNELIVVDDGSDDNTAAVAEQSLADFPTVTLRVIPYEPNRGNGQAWRMGLMATQLHFVLFSEAVPSTRCTEAPKLLG